MNDACERTLENLDSYISSELPLETRRDVLRHLETCPNCSAEWENRKRLRTSLRAAVQRQDVPPELRVRVRERIRSRDSRGWLGIAWNRWAVAMAAGLMVCAAVWLNSSRERMPALSDRPGQDAYIQKVSAKLAAVLKVGLADHVHCSVFRRYPQNPPAVEQMAETLGPSYKGLLPLVQAAVPDGYRVIMAHQCGYKGRKYIHLTLQNGGNLLSLVIARKNAGESLDSLAPALHPSGISVYQSAAGQYQVAGFEAGPFLAYVVSDLKGTMNLQIAGILAPSVYNLLTKTAA